MSRSGYADVGRPKLRTLRIRHPLRVPFLLLSYPSRIIVRTLFGVRSAMLSLPLTCFNPYCVGFNLS